MITPNGLVIKRMAEIIEEFNSSARATFGEAIDVSPVTPLGQLIGIFAEREATIWELMQDIYNNQYPTTASGISLDQATYLTGTTRRPATRSNIKMGIARGSQGTVVPAGTIIAVEGNPNAQFATENDATIDIPSGANYMSGNIIMNAVETGPLAVRGGTLTVIVTPVVGMTSFSNLDNAVMGSNVETDADLKARRTQELNLAGSGTLEAIRSALSARPTVTAVQVFQNNSAVQINNRPPHSIEILVLGDDEDDLAAAIFNVVGAGITMIGNVTKAVTDSQGHEQTIRFSRPTPVNVFVDFVIETTENFPGDGETQIKDGVLAWGDSLTIGQDIVLVGTDSLVCVLDKIPGIVSATVTIGRSAGNLEARNLQLETSEIAAFASDNITVTIN